MRRMYSEEQVKKMIQNALSSGQMKDVKVFEDIVDKDGHARFIEGDIDLAATTPEGVTKVYGKWSLSGSHLMIVLAGVIADGTTIGGAIWAKVNMPSWIINKIYPIFSNKVVQLFCFLIIVFLFIISVMSTIMLQFHI